MIDSNKQKYTTLTTTQLLVTWSQTARGSWHREDYGPSVVAVKGSDEKFIVLVHPAPFMLHRFDFVFHETAKSV